jgi:hypothetical protein
MLCRIRIIRPDGSFLEPETLYSVAMPDHDNRVFDIAADVRATGCMAQIIEVKPCAERASGMPNERYS